MFSICLVFQRGNLEFTMQCVVHKVWTELDKAACFRHLILRINYNLNFNFKPLCHWISGKLYWNGCSLRWDRGSAASPLVWDKAPLLHDLNTCRRCIRADKFTYRGWGWLVALQLISSELVQRAPLPATMCLSAKRVQIQLGAFQTSAPAATLDRTKWRLRKDGWMDHTYLRVSANVLI